ncbi:Signal peptidase complex-like protein [Actinidia chinensis var. chinensis]|uniref:Signal peptidase complex-like protein n=1 Tax=Actinidia chinensis var. chinensis TaxID=1590841 RepID=A0A2R6RNN0_ACTCC|nr:Signal peptidase complex-like protein [Actinidia chinensis var. chinensis]
MPNAAAMPADPALRSSLLWLAAIVVVTGLYTQSLKKMGATYLVGILAIAGVLLPDWDFFDRPVSQWCSPISVDLHDTPQTPKPPTRFKFYPVRLVIYTAVYGFAFYKWWMFISN